MTDQREVVVLSGVRTAIGAYGGGLKDQPPTELAAAVCARQSRAPASSRKSWARCLRQRHSHRPARSCTWRAWPA